LQPELACWRPARRKLAGCRGGSVASKTELFPVPFLRSNDQFGFVDGEAQLGGHFQRRRRMVAGAESQISRVTVTAAAGVAEIAKISFSPLGACMGCCPQDSG